MTQEGRRKDLLVSEVKRIYICGAITPTGRGNHSVEHLTNIKNGIKAGKMLMRLGFSPYNPFLDYPYWLVDDGDFFLSVDRIRQMDMDWIDKSDAVLVLPGFKRSVGAKAEIERAKRQNIPVFYEVDDLIAYREGK